MKHLLAILLLAGCARPAEPGAVEPAPVPPPEPAPLTVLEPARALHRAMEAGTAPPILDVRPPEVFAAGHIRGAINLGRWELKVHPSASRAVVVGSGHESGERWLPGGMAAWCRADLPVVGSCDGAGRLSAQAVLTSPDLPVVARAPIEGLDRVVVSEDRLAAVEGPTVVATCDAEDERALRAALTTVDAHVLMVSAPELAEAAARQAAMANRREVTTRGAALAASEPIRAPKGCGCP